MKLFEIAHARSGDKGNSVNIGIIARKPEHYPVLKEKLTEMKVKDFLGEFCLGKVERYELENLNALNFVLHNCLRGGGTLNLKLDSQGKTLGMALLKMDI